ncbi:MULTISPECIES: glycerophosphodiester phosphodiesterase family protein [Kordiimonas]|jgi:glycerophosphoryl diester phosphodiesterase|uniref:glycerophosphodiester phosphodiesterase family protein n=1 Tax=Kordiimonas TaxID=288021 RepID=UPI00257D06EA|nr:glycerophosphodiester phosphodiesterase family protein [Kordiimonas sp. UBA4487]
MIKRLQSLAFLFALFLSCPIVQAENVPPPVGDSYYYLEVPPGGLADFFRWHPLRIPLVSHHRGAPAPGFAENSIEAMQNALRYGPGLMEVDVAQLADGTLILMHDNTLDRTTTGKGRVAEAVWPDIAPLTLVDQEGRNTGHRVPKLSDVLRWTTGRAILTLDIKTGTDFRAVAREVEAAGASDYVVAITYSLDQALEYQAIAPSMMQTVTMRNVEELAAVEASGLKPETIIAWTGTSLAPKDFYQMLHDRGWRVIVGTLGNPGYSIDGQIFRSGDDSKYLDILNLGADVIATDRFWAVQGQIMNPNIFVFTRSKLYR